MDQFKNMGFETKAIHTAQEPDSEFGSVMPPIHLSSTYAQSTPGTFKKYDYIRAGNPTRSSYSKCVAALEGAEHGFAYSSGCAATTTLMQCFKAGDHIIAGDDMYGGTFRLFDKVLRKFGLEFSFVDLTNPENFEKAIRPNTRLVWLETPTNPTLKISDIDAISKIAQQSKILTAVDNTFMSPYFQNPLKWGADVVMHSATKYINGHSDVLGGLLLTNDNSLAEDLSFYTLSTGAVASPFDSYLALRSLKTLAVRMQTHQKNAIAVAEFLEGHSAVERVIYPGLSSHPQYDLAKKQMSGFGGMITFYVKSGLNDARRFLENVKVFTLAESLGGVESLVEHPAIMTHASIPPDKRKALGIDDTLIRLSVGIETQSDLIQDLDQALSQ